MEKKFTDFSPHDAQKLAQTPAAQQLIALFQQQPEANRVASSAQKGDLEQARKGLQDFMDNPQTKALLRQLWEEYHG
jgi:DNA polymerase IIIc chi subunit